MTTRKERHQHVVDDSVLSDDDLAKFVEDAFAAFSDTLDAVGASLRLVLQTRASLRSSMDECVGNAASVRQGVDDFVDAHAVGQ